MLEETKTRIYWSLKSELDFNKLTTEHRDIIIRELAYMANKRIQFFKAYEKLSDENTKIAMKEPMMLVRSE